MGTQLGNNYECYSKKVFGYLTLKGHRYKYSFIHNRTDAKCWVYEMTKELSQSLKDYQQYQNEENR